MDSQRIAFVIMQIGNPLLDEIYSDVYIPAIEAANLVPKRIDHDNEGQLLKKEIIEYLEKAEIIIADLTNERPNCYLEIGYAMGLDKFRNLVFTVKEDHYPESKNFKLGGPKVHFDIAGYDILFWDPENLGEFKLKLTDKINRRLSILGPTIMKVDKLLSEESDLTWHRNHIAEQFKKLELKRQMEVHVFPINYKLNISQNELLDISNDSQILTMGWPIGIVFKDAPGLKPISKADGILSEVEGSSMGKSYDFSYFKKNGQIFIAKSLFEENRQENSYIIIETRIRRITELLIYLQRFYLRCNLPQNEAIKIALKYSGFKNNKLIFGSSDYLLRGQKVSNENEYSVELITTCSEIEAKLTEKVNEILEGFFVLFDFFKADHGIIKNIVSEFVKNARR